LDRKAWEANGLRPYPWTLIMKPLRKLPQYLPGFKFGEQNISSSHCDPWSSQNGSVIKKK